MATLLLEDLDGEREKMLFAFGRGHVGEVEIGVERVKNHLNSQ